jgi:hypothetical protein
MAGSCEQSIGVAAKAPDVGIKTRNRKGQRHLDLGNALCNLVLATIDRRSGL